MMPRKTEPNRYVQLTDRGLKRLHETRRRYRKTIDDIVYDENTPSVNTIKRVLRQGPVFVDTLEKIWDYLRCCAEEKKEVFPDLIRDEDYIFVEGTARAESTVVEPAGEPLFSDNRWGWLSRSVPRPNRLFTGRKDVLDRLHVAHKEGATALVPDAQALTGMGGIGKTQTAIAYIYAHRSYYNGVYWVNAETVETLNDGLASLAEELSLLNSASATKQEALQKMHDWLQNGSDWLLVLDNADELSTLAPHFPHHHTGRLLLTTRARNTIQTAEPIEIVKFTPDEGALLLLRRAGVLSLNQTLDDAPPAVCKSARELSEELDGLPLALDQAGAYLSETTLTVPEYLAKYRQYGLELLDRAQDPGHVSISVTFRLALEQMAQRGRFGQAAVELVRLCAFLAPDAIPESIFTSYPFPQDELRSPLKEVDYYFEVSAALCGYSLLRRDPKTKTLSIHRLVQKVIRDTMSAEESHAWMERAVHAVAAASPDFEFDDWSLCELCLPHWRLCAEYIQQNQIFTQQAATLLYQAGRYIRERALYGEAETLLKLSLEIAEKAYGEKHPVTANCLDALACLYRELDRPQDAEPLHRRALEITEEVEGPEHPATGAKLHNIALFYTEQKDYARAEACFLRALEIREQHLTPDHPGVATTLTQLGAVYRCQECYEKAEPCYRRALKIYEDTLEPDHLDVAIGCNNLALFCYTTGRYEEAETLYARALTINEKARGEDHPETGAVVWGLALVRWKQGRADEANTLFQRAIKIYQQNYSPGHSRLARLLSFYEDFRKETAACQ